jgi:hypothetical protein
MAISEEAYMFAERYAHFSNVHTIYRDLISGHYQPSVNMNSDPRVPSADFTMQDVHTTMMFVIYAYFYSMVEDDPQGVNGFRVWRAAWPEEENAIAAVEALVTPLVPGLKLFRNRLGFHGSRSRSHEAKAFDLFSQHSGTAVWNAMANFKSLGAALFKKDLDRQHGIDPSPAAREWIDRIAAKSLACKP